MTTIRAISTRDARYPLTPGAGSDAVHTDPEYAFAATELHTDDHTTATGLAFTLCAGNELVCRAIEQLAQPLIGQEVESLMSRWGEISQQLADHPALRWLGPHKGVIHLALSSITNACFDLWAKSRGLPLWQLLLELPPRDLINTLDLTYVEDVLSPDDALNLLQREQPGRADRMDTIDAGYPGYDTSVGWFAYSDEQIVDNARRALEAGFTAMKLKVGSKDLDRDLRRVQLVREAVGDNVRLMVDANQQWRWPTAERACRELSAMGMFWIEEPTHPDDVLGHRRLAEIVAPTGTHIALGEHVPNRVVFKNYIQAEAVHIVQVDAVRVAGVSEFITVSMMARNAGLTVVPHVGDTGQLNQHLVLFNHVALGMDRLFLEHIPHLNHHFTHPAVVRDGLYETPRVPGATCDLKPQAI